MICEGADGPSGGPESSLIIRKRSPSDEMSHGENGGVKLDHRAAV